MPSIINATTTNGVAISPDNSGSLQLATNNGTTAVTIDTSQNVNIGTTGVAEKLVANGAIVSKGQLGALQTSSMVTDYNSGNIGRIIATGPDASTYPPIVFANTTTTTYAERMRITSGGDVLIGTTSFSVGTNGISLGSASNSRININNNTDYGIEMYGSTSSRISFYSSAGNTTRVGAITVNTTNTTYGTSSDYRLKENIAPMTGALATVAQLKPVTYKWKVDGSDGQGFIAHELQAVVPECVTGEKDAVDEEGKPVYQGVDTSFLVATLTAAIQEQQTIINDLKARIETLEAK